MDCLAHAHCLRANNDFTSTVIDTVLYEKRKPHTTPKRFSLIDFEGPRVVNSTGMHRNATLLNSSAMERLRSLSATPLHSLFSLLSPLSAVCTTTTARSFSRSIPFLLRRLVEPFPLSFSPMLTWFNICTQIDNEKKGE